MKHTLLLILLICWGITSAQNEIITPAGQPLKVGIHGLKLANITSDSTVSPSNGKVLSVDNTGKVFLAPAGSSQWTTNAGTIYYAGSGLTNVGIGTNNPVQKLDVNGNVNIAVGSLMFDNSRILGQTATNNLTLGKESGFQNPTGGGNTFLGMGTGYFNTTGSSNCFLGGQSGYSNVSGILNCYVGTVAGRGAKGGSNTFVGYGSGFVQELGDRNTYLGGFTGYTKTSGERNTFIGFGSGQNNVSGSKNVFIGYGSGATETGSNKLYISNTSIAPLIYGEFDNNLVTINGKVGVSTSNFPTTAGGADISAYKLFVKGGILAEEVRVSTGWADYVFDRQYKLKSLSEVARFISKNGHLPNVPSAKEVEAQGIELGTIARIQQEKIEELTLYAIEQEKRLDRQQKDLADLRALVNTLVQQKEFIQSRTGN